MLIEMLEKNKENINNLKRVTQELALSVENDEMSSNNVFKFLKLIFDNLDDTPVEIVSSDHVLLYANQALKDKVRKANGFVLREGDVCYRTIWGIDEICNDCLLDYVVNCKRVRSIDKMYPDGKCYRLVLVPLIYNGISGIIVMASEIDKMEC